MSIQVGIAGVTGAVGQTFAKLLKDHPVFKVVQIGASANSAGKKFRDISTWRMSGPMPEFLDNITIVECKAEHFQNCKVVFSGLDASVAGQVETDFANAGIAVFSNARNHRGDKDVPIMFPTVNPDHLQIVKQQTSFKTKGGFIVTNANCSSTGLVIALKPIEDKFGIEHVCVSTMQAISGAGFPGIHAPDIHDNVVPFISGEETKIELEPLKMFGKVTENMTIAEHSMRIVALCHRVPVMEGHTLSMTFKVKNLCGATNNEELSNMVRDCLREHRPVPEVAKLNMCPRPVIEVFTCDDRPQPRLDRDIGGGMVTSVGRIRPSNTLGEIKMVAVSHNTISGAAGASILNAELAVHNSYIKV